MASGGCVHGLGFNCRGGNHGFGLKCIACMWILYWFFIMASGGGIHGFGLKCVAFMSILYWFFVMTSLQVVSVALV